MRIDLNASSMPELSRSSGSAATDRAAGAASEPAAATSEDVAHLSTGSEAVQNLKAQLQAVPDVRQLKVNNLRQKIADGGFQVSAERTAESMLADAERTPGKAS